MRSMNASLSSSAPSLIGAPTDKVQSNGTGSSWPLGMTRREFSIQTGTNSTSGQACAR